MKIWYGVVYQYPKGKLPTEDLFSFKLINERGDLLEFGENLPSIFRSFETAGYPNVRLVLLKETAGVSFEQLEDMKKILCQVPHILYFMKPLPAPIVAMMNCQKTIWVFRQGGRIFFTDGFKTTSTEDKAWQNALLALFYQPIETKTSLS
ncbi:MAG: hypothetical protein ACD_12C00522G0001 [uncultured bacterium]|nr:MAG: hypothetical protein ACD_12C00522G0001 [uncultured bacterium]